MHNETACANFPTGVVDVRQPLATSTPVYFCIMTQQNVTFLEYGDLGMGPTTPKFELGRDFCTLHLVTKFQWNCFIILHLITES